jgi:hypothetical protein
VDSLGSCGCAESLIELLFYRDVGVCCVRKVVLGPCADSWQRPSSARPKAVSRLPAFPATTKSEFRLAASGEAEILRVLRQEFRSEAGDRRKDAISLPTTFLPRLLAFRCTQLVKGPSRKPELSGSNRTPAPASQGEELSLSEETQEREKGGTRAGVGRSVRQLRIRRRGGCVGFPPQGCTHEGVLNQQVQRLMGTAGR